MIRTLLSVLAVSGLVFAQAHLAGASQGRSSAPAPKPAAHAAININTASASDLEALPGVGAKTAALIVEYRQKNGPFKKIEDLMNIRGIGEKNFLKLREQLTVGTPRTDRPDQQAQQK